MAKFIRQLEQLGLLADPSYLINVISEEGTDLLYKVEFDDLGLAMEEFSNIGIYKPTITSVRDCLELRSGDSAFLSVELLVVDYISPWLSTVTFVASVYGSGGPSNDISSNTITCSNNAYASDITCTFSLEVDDFVFPPEARSLPPRLFVGQDAIVRTQLNAYVYATKLVTDYIPPNTWTRVIYENVEEDRQNNFTVGGIFTAPEPGLYMCDFQLRLIAAQSNDWYGHQIFEMRLSNNDAQHTVYKTSAHTVFIFPGMSDITKFNCSSVIYLAESLYTVGFYVRHTLPPPDPFISIALLDNYCTVTKVG